MRSVFYFCTGGEARTPDTRFWRPVLYQLSYSRVCGCKGKLIFLSCNTIVKKICFFYFIIFTMQYFLLNIVLYTKLIINLLIY